MIPEDPVEIVPIRYWLGKDYDLVPQQSKIPFAVQQKRETSLPSFGEKLKLEREKRKITLEQISLSTKIGTRMLQALEENRFNQLPGGIFNKGFVRAYSRFIGLDEDQTVADYLEASGDAPPPSTEIAPREDSARENEENVRRLEAAGDYPRHHVPWGLFAAVLLAVALALFLWSHRQRERAKQLPAATPSSSAAPLPATPFSGEASAENSGAPSLPGRSPSSSSSTASTAPRNLASQALPTDPAAPGEFTVVIQAREESWISVTADRKAVASELLAAGGELQVRGRTEIIVKAGNAGGVDFRFNGTKLNTGGEYGEVKTVTFGLRGIVPNAPEPPATP
jgi:cytoskeleton protein RodZ